jgi:hypothetical protein
MNAQRARHREAERIRQVAQRRRQRRRRLAALAALTLVLVAGIAGWAVAVAGRSDPATATGGLPGLQTGPAPWSADTADLAARLRAIGLPPLSPAEGTAVHIHQHLDLYVDGTKVPVPAGIGIDPRGRVRPPPHPRRQRGDPRRVPHRPRLHPWGVLRRVGVRFTPGCLGGYCAAGDRRLRVYADGRPVHGDPTALTLASHQELVVAFGTAAQLPSPLPSAYRFPPGL